MPSDRDAIYGIAPYESDDDLIDAVARTGRGEVRLSRPEAVFIVLGRGGDPERELNLDACRGDGVPILRRRGGGGAVLLDPGNLVLSVVWPLPGIAGIGRAFDLLSRFVAAELARLGAGGIERRGTSDLAAGDRKVGGSCIFRRRDLLYYSTTLLCEPSIDLMERYLAHPPREPDYRRGRSHRDFVTSLARLVPGLTTERAFRRLLPRLTAKRLERSLRQPASREAS